MRISETQNTVKSDRPNNQNS